MKEIDIVITWVDGNDPAWQEERRQYAPSSGGGEIRFRDWDNLQYLFRGIEQHMPWANRIYFVTWGHTPRWLNTENPKLRVVRHDAFIPREYLPTFNSNAIELNLHRIEGLAEQFICFNDDMFVVRETRPEDFFERGMPKDFACISPQPIYRSSIMNIELNNLKVINDYFSIDDIKKRKTKWIRPFLYGSYNLRTLMFSMFHSIIGIFQPHIPYALLKSTYQTLWDREYALLDATCRNRFRSTDDVNIWLLRSWQLASGNFLPRTSRFGLLVSASDEKGIRQAVRSGRRLVCINDDESVKDFAAAKRFVREELDSLFPQPSSFEIVP